ncbi:MAG: LysR family transcriptional regulator [Suipraeoptans sp.]
MELRQLEYYCMVCRLKSYTKAAIELHVSQPTLTISIKKLEDELGVKCLERDNKKLILTKEGQIFFAEAKKLLLDADHLIQLMSDYSIAHTKRLRVAFPSTIGSRLWKLLLVDFNETFPDIELSITDSGTIEILKALELGEVEVGFGVVDVNENPNIESHILFENELMVILHKNHPLTQEDRPSLEDLVNEHIVMYRQNTTFTEKLFQKALKEKGLEAHPRHVREQATVFDIVSQGLGISFTLDGSRSILRQSRDIVVRPLADPIHFQTGTFWRKDKYLSASARKLIEFLDEKL